MRRAVPDYILACEATDNVANAAQHALHARLSILAKSTPNRRYQLSFSDLMDSILSLGPLAEAIAPLGYHKTIISPPRDPITRNAAVARLVSTVRFMARCVSPFAMSLVLMFVSANEW